MVYEYGVFRALKKANNGECWNDWPEEYRTWPENRQKLPAEVETEAQYQMFLQYIFYTQWMKVKKAANDAGIQIMGDVPFYVGQDSVDVWGGKDNFFLIQMDVRSSSPEYRLIISVLQGRDGEIRSMTGSI